MGDLKLIHRTCRELCGDNEDDFETAVIMLASARVGCNSAKIKKLTGIRSETCQLVCRKMRYHKIWVKGAKLVDGKWIPTDTLHHGGWDDEKTGSIAFVCDMLCVQGMLERSQDAEVAGSGKDDENSKRDTTTQYAPTDSLAASQGSSKEA